MKRALLILLVAVGCTPTVVLGTLSLDAGGTDFAGCPGCDFALPRFDAFGPRDGDFGGSDLGDAGLVDLAL